MRKQSGRTSCAVERVAVRLCVVIALLAASFPLSLFSQGSTGTIQGGVFDSSGGAIAGARVTVTDVARGTTRTLTTDESGQYVAPSLTTGSYTVRAEANGFSALERSNVQLEVGQIVRVDLTLAPGEQTQTVTVTEEVPAIDTTSATLGGTVSNKAIQALPLNGRNFMRLLELRPGVVTHPGDNTSASSTNGRRSGADILLIDGTFFTGYDQRQQPGQWECQGLQRRFIQCVAGRCHPGIPVPNRTPRRKPAGRTDRL